jgi:FKBP-type peptidyl-prolyl cis-trans isomerase
MNISCLFLLTIFGVLLVALSVSVANASNEIGIEFLVKNKNNDNIITLESGLQYKILKKGNGLYHPTIDSSCSCHYEGKLLDGTIFDSSYERNSPSSFAPNQVIKGWTEAMQLMVAGDKVRFNKCLMLR